MAAAIAVVLGIAATPPSAPGVSVLQNGGFEEDVLLQPLLLQQTSDQEDQVASWALSKGATLQWQEGDEPAYEGDACLRLSGSGAWAEQTTSIGGEANFVLSLWAKQCGQAAWLKGPLCVSPHRAPESHSLARGWLPSGPRGGEPLPPWGRERRLRLRPSTTRVTTIPTALSIPPRPRRSLDRAAGHT